MHRQAGREGAARRAGPGRRAGRAARPGRRAARRARRSRRRSPRCAPGARPAPVVAVTRLQSRARDRGAAGRGRRGDRAGTVACWPRGVRRPRARPAAGSSPAARSSRARATRSRWSARSSEELGVRSRGRRLARRAAEPIGERHLLTGRRGLAGRAASRSRPSTTGCAGWAPTSSTRSTGWSRTDPSSSPSCSGSRALYAGATVTRPTQADADRTAAPARARPPRRRVDRPGRHDGAGTSPRAAASRWSPAPPARWARSWSPSSSTSPPTRTTGSASTAAARSPTR